MLFCWYFLTRYDVEDARFVDIPHVFKEKAVDVIFCPCCQRKDEELKVSHMYS